MENTFCIHVCGLSSKYYSIVFYSFSEYVFQSTSFGYDDNATLTSQEPTINVMKMSRRQQRQSLQHLREACTNKDLFQNKTYRGKYSLRYYFSSDYNFSYCKVPKAGCSFWTQVFSVLQKGPKAAKKIFGMARSSVHQHYKSFVVKFDSAERRKSRTILVSRDPYSRLFSAFIDKMFLPLSYPQAIGIVKRQRNISPGKFSCANDLTFQEFLQDAVETVRGGRTVNRHWAPIFSLCNPCEVDAFVLVKQESFSSDVEFALQEIGIAGGAFKAIHDALHDHRVDSTIPGIVATVMRFCKKAKKCMSNIEIARRIWVSFQIQGYIKDSIAFPKNIIDTEKKANSGKFLTNLILTTIRQHPMTSEESKIQRRRALASAYDGVSDDVIDGLKDVYKQDFVLFDYSPDPPSGT